MLIDCDKRVQRKKYSFHDVLIWVSFQNSQQVFGVIKEIRMILDFFFSSSSSFHLRFFQINNNYYNNYLYIILYLYYIYYIYITFIYQNKYNMKNLFLTLYEWYGSSTLGPESLRALRLTASSSSNTLFWILNVFSGVCWSQFPSLEIPVPNDSITSETNLASTFHIFFSFHFSF